MNDQPVPTPEDHPEQRRFRLGVVLAIVLPVAVVVLVGLTVRLPAYSIGPGPARDVGALIKVAEQETFPSRGQLLLMTVSVSDRPLTIFEGLRAWLDPAVRVVEREVIVRPGLDDRGQDILNRHDIEQSKLVAQVVAFRALGHEVDVAPGARVVTVIEGTPAEGELEPGDVIVAVDGTPVANPDGAGDSIAKRDVGDTVELTVSRDGRRRTVRLRTAESQVGDAEPAVGVTVGPAYRLPFEVDVDTGEVGGPSGGLVFALAIVDALGRDDLTAGYRIAGTGTIAEDGTVGRVGGIEEKILAADRARADIFLAPADEVAQAERVAKKVRVIGVSTLAEARAALGALPPRGARDEAA